MYEFFSHQSSLQIWTPTGCPSVQFWHQLPEVSETPLVKDIVPQAYPPYTHTDVNPSMDVTVARWHSWKGAPVRRYSLDDTCLEGKQGKRTVNGVWHEKIKNHAEVSKGKKPHHRLWPKNMSLGCRPESTISSLWPWRSAPWDLATHGKRKSYKKYKYGPLIRNWNLDLWHEVQACMRSACFPEKEDFSLLETGLCVKSLLQVRRHHLRHVLCKTLV